MYNSKRLRYDAGARAKRETHAYETYRDLDGGGGGDGGARGVAQHGARNDDDEWWTTSKDEKNGDVRGGGAATGAGAGTSTMTTAGVSRLPSRRAQDGQARLFVAIALDDVSRLHLCGLPLSHIATQRHIDEKDFHITLNFIGSENVHKVHEALTQVRFNRFDARLKGVGAFPSRKLPLTLWVGVEAGRELFELQTLVKQTLRANGVRLTDKHEVYRPHVTVAWVVKSDGALEAAKEFLDANEAFEAARFSVAELVLMESPRAGSARADGGGKYVVRARYALQ